MRPIKVIAWVLGGLIGLVAIALVAVVLLVDPNDYKDEIAQAVKDQTGRQLTLEGDLKLSVFPWLALQTGRAELGNAAGFGPGPFLTLERADVGVRLIPLLRGEMQVRRLELDGLRVSLVENAEGTTNWEDLTRADPDASPQPEGKTQIPSIAGVSIKNSTLDYRNLGTASRMRLDKLDLETGRIESGKPIELQLQFALDEGEGTAQKFVRLKTVATFEEERYTLADLELDATLPAAEGRDMEIALRAPSAVADLQAQTLALPKFELKAAGAELAGSLDGKQIVDAPAFTGTLALKPVSPRELMAQLGMEAPQTRDPAVLESMAFDAKLVASKTSVMLEDLTLTLDDTRATGKAGIADLDETALRFDLAVDRLDLDRYSGPEEKPEGGKDKAAGKDEDEEPFELPLELLKTLDAQGKLRIGQLTLAGLKMSDVLVTVDAADGLVRVNPSQAKLYGGGHRGAFAVDARGDTAKLSVDESLASIDFASLFKDLFDSQRLVGQGNIKAVLAGRGNDSHKLASSLDGRIEFNVQDGAIKGADLWYELRRARARWERQPGPAQPSTGETRFKTLTGTAEVKSGVLENRDLVIDMDYLKVTGEGKYEIPTGKVDYRLTANVYRVPAEGAGAEMASLQAAQIPVRVSGTLADLKIRPDVEGLAKAKAKQKIEEKKQELTDKLSEKLGDFLKKKQK